MRRCSRLADRFRAEMRMYDLVGSIVLYKTDEAVLRRAAGSFLNSFLATHLCLVDNSPEPSEFDWLPDERVEYIFTGENRGYGAGHNVAIRQYLDRTKYHLVLNPDVYFDRGTLEHLFSFMEANPDVAHVMPKVLCPDGTVQYLCKLLPTPQDLIFRRFLPWRSHVERRNDVFELRLTGYDRMMDVPYLSGCFMFLRAKALAEVGLFDERFFMYPEDIDLTRRLHVGYRTVFNPEVAVFHEYAKGSYKTPRLLWVHITSMIKYFNKWGWIFDRTRRRVNRETLAKLRQSP